MYQIMVEQHFNAAHALRGYQGKCENLHGHRFKVVAHIKASKLNEIGLAYDFRELKARLCEVLERYDHTNLNEIAPFNNINPSSENIARYLFERMAQRLNDGNRWLYSVSAWESADACATFMSE